MSLRDRLRGRERPSVPYRLPVANLAGPVRALELAAQAWRVTLLRTDEGAAEAVAAARAVFDAAQEALDACYEEINMRALAPDDFELLVGEHPPREEDDGKYNPETFPLAVFLACAPADLPEKEWVEFLKSNVSSVEREELLELGIHVNTRRVNPGIPKD